MMFSKKILILDQIENQKNSSNEKLCPTMVLETTIRGIISICSTYYCFAERLSALEISLQIYQQ